MKTGSMMNQVRKSDSDTISMLGGEWKASVRQQNQFGGGVVGNDLSDFRITPQGKSELVVSGPGLVGLAFTNGVRNLDVNLGDESRLGHADGDVFEIAEHGHDAGIGSGVDQVSSAAQRARTAPRRAAPAPAPGALG